MPGFVGEWLWYSATREENVEGHELALLDPPSWNVTEGGGDGFVVHRTSGGSDTVLQCCRRLSDRPSPVSCPAPKS